MIKRVNPQAVGFDAERLARLSGTMSRFVDEGRLAGTVTVVARKGRIAHLESVGMADIERGVPMQDDTIFRIYSMSKPIVSAALMTLVEENLVGLNDPASRYLPAFKDMQVVTGGTFENPELEDCEQEVTIAHLLTHTSGLLYGHHGRTVAHRLMRAAIESAREANPELNTAEGVDAMLTAPLAFQPGKAFGYGTNLDIVGRIIEIVSGQTLDVFLKERIFDPLGMVDTAFSVPDDKVGRFAATYAPDVDGTGMRCIDDPQTSRYRGPVHYLEGGGGLVSTAGDYVRFGQAMLNGGELEGTRILGPRTLAAMCRNHLPAGIWARNQPGLGWGLGWAIHMDPGALHELVSPGVCRWDGAADTEFWFDPQEDLVCVVMTQLRPSEACPTLAPAMTAVYQALVD